jgi:hypothetical protein
MRILKKYLGRVAIGVIVVFLVLYAGDWGMLRYRVAHGTAFDSVEVNQFLATPLKGSKTEYDLMGSYQQTCSRSIFPQQGQPACWWVRRHSAQWE